MRLLTAFLIPFLVFPLVGCKPVGQIHASLQYHNLDFRLVKSKMTITVGDGSIDARKLMEQETYVGSITCGRVKAEYPEGLQETAQELAQEFNEFYSVVERRFGISWDYNLVIKLIRVQSAGRGYRYAAKFGRDRSLTFPVLITENGQARWWTPIIAHELTEASLIAPEDRSQLVLADLYSGSFCIPSGTRWFRDGVSDYVQYVFDDRLPPSSVYAELNIVRNRLLDWSNCQGQPNWYDASAGLICEMVNRFGVDSVRKMMEELSKEPVPGRRGIARAFKRATGVDLEEFLTGYQTPWAGIVVRDTRPVGSDDNQVRVLTVYPATPASRRGIRVGDVITNFAGEPVRSSDEFEDILAKQTVWQMVPVEVKRDDENIPMRLKLIPRPTDINQFLILSGVKEAGR